MFWCWVFYINLLFGIVVLLFGFLFLVEYVEKLVGCFDLFGFILLVLGFVMFIYVFS